ncbi:GmrSD restriction endonuclease domain-containing protein [Fontivita pretiosa]|uniref:GmrSD restriction endonuclease domain-containing protein n=1 Tax=Fontivita pretiosa TaxID=2989684 RepID=UPI003D184350
MSRKTIQIHAMRLSQVIKCIDQGRFAIPKLQREFVWDGPKAAKLFDSMLSHMPIGVVMIWETPRSQRLYLRQKYHVLPPFNPRNSKVWFLIDGQQRISVVYRVHEGNTLRNARGKAVDFSRVVLSLEKEDDGQQIRYRRPQQGRYESLTEILHPNWRTRLSHLGPRAKERVRKCRDQVLRYPMHLMFVQAPIQQIRESFLRINTQGMKITTADAIFTQAEDLDLRDIRHEVRQHLDDSFGQISEMPILFAMAAVRGGTEARGRALRQVIQGLEREARHNTRLRKTLSNDWSRLGVCFGKAVDYLRQNFRVLSRDYLYSDYMVSILAAFFYWNGRGPSPKQRNQIRKWFWATAVGSRYSGTNFLRCLPDDLRFYKRLAQNQRARFTYKPETEKIDVRKAQYASRTGIAAACYCMMLRRKPVSIQDDGLNEIPLDRYSTSANRKDRHHIFPRAVLAKLGVHAKLYNSICNICLLTAEENQSIGMRRPRSYLGEVKRDGTHFKQKMSRHLIPVHDQSGIWMRDARKGFMRFMKERTDLICQALEDEAGTRLFRRDL